MGAALVLSLALLGLAVGGAGPPAAMAIEGIDYGARVVAAMPSSPPSGGGGLAVATEPVFGDLGEAGVLAADVEELAAEGVFEGTECEPGKFCPNQPIARWVMAVWLVRIMDGGDPSPTGAVSFVDVIPDVWWADHVNRLAELGITRGCATDPLRYCPDQPVARAQMAAFLNRAFELRPAAAAGFVDTGDSFAAADIDALFASGVTRGCGVEPLRFCPDQPVTRAQMAAFLNRAGALKPTPTFTPEEAPHAALSRMLPWYDDPPYPLAVLPIVEVWLRDPDLGRDLAEALWVIDGVGPLESNAVYGLGRLYDWDPALARRMLAYSAEEPVRTGNVHTLNVLGDMTWQQPDSLKLLQDQGWFADGLSPEERAFVIVLGKVAGEGALYTDLLKERFTLATAIDLPLSGAVRLWAFGHDAIEGDVLGAMEAGARAAERIMASPLPVTDLILLQVNAEQYGGGFGGVNHRDSMVLSIGSDWPDTAHAGLLYHEVAHYHLAFEVGPHWLVEGGANFVAAYRQAWDGTEDWDGRVELFEGDEYAGRKWCLDNGVSTIAALAEPGPYQVSCGYHLGQYLLTALYNNIGESAFIATMAELYGRYLGFLPWPSEEEIYRIILKHTPPDREQALYDVYQRFHGGSFLDGD